VPAAVVLLLFHWSCLRHNLQIWDQVGALTQRVRRSSRISPRPLGLLSCGTFPAAGVACTFSVTVSAHSERNATIRQGRKWSPFTACSGVRVTRESDPRQARRLRRPSSRDRNASGSSDGSVVSNRVIELVWVTKKPIVSVPWPRTGRTYRRTPPAR
jgi:hypothetical protein